MRDSSELVRISLTQLFSAPFFQIDKKRSLVDKHWSDVQSDVSADMCVTGMHGIAANSYLWSWIVGMLSSDNPFGEMPKRFSFGRSYTLSACLHRYVELLVLGSRWIPK